MAGFQAPGSILVPGCCLVQQAGQDLAWNSTGSAGLSFGLDPPFSPEWRLLLSQHSISPQQIPSTATCRKQLFCNSGVMASLAVPALCHSAVFVLAIVPPEHTNLSGAHTHWPASGIRRSPGHRIHSSSCMNITSAEVYNPENLGSEGLYLAGQEACRPAQSHFYAIVPFQRCIKAAKEGGFLMVPGEQSRNIRPNFITESSETLEERFPLIIINSRKKSFPPKAGSSCLSVFSHLHFQ